ncbi:DnaJ-domain-containing protein [Choiromyces venosus 120613-1]|uniref:DnaJ-domain-containing protein n=1 Tax=Choiromyces venosus 120613-1 TaxID=1336337 RepID=A0A3N4K3K9_9PEZI|nr:DnaJ-domain-containing protein [Choiromyces venosus 120613-1]
MSDDESSSSASSFDSTPPPTSKSPYEILSISPTSTAAEIRSAYRKLALTVHPDKVSEDKRDAAKIAFQELTFAYGVLSDETRRRRFDETGSTSENAEGEVFDWKAFYKAQMEDLVTSENLAKFKGEYQGSEEEKQAVLAAYSISEGSMDKIFESVMCSDVLEDEERFRKIITEEIDAGRVKAFRNFTHESKASKKQRKDKAQGERREAEAYAKELGIHDELFNAKKKAKAEDVEDGDGEEEEGTAKKSKGKKKSKKTEDDDISGLKNLIQKRSNNRLEEMISNLEAKYLPKPKGRKAAAATTTSKRKKATNLDDEEEEEEEAGPSEPTEEQFRAARTRIEKNKKSKNTKEVKGKVKNVKEDTSDTTAPRRSKRVKR